jgi:hypothetical protein
MKTVVVSLLILSSSLSLANGVKLQFSGRVTEKVDVQEINGQLRVTQNSKDLKVSIVSRGPASVVKVEAP